MVSTTQHESVPVFTPTKVNNIFYHVAGIGVMALNKLRHELQGYKSTRGFSTDELQRVIDYDYKIKRIYEDGLNKYLNGEFSWKRKRVLELGPGADLGIALILLAQGAEAYHSLDVNYLLDQSSDELYARFFQVLESDPQTIRSVEELRPALSDALKGAGKEINYVCDNDFDVRVFKDDGINVVVSNAAVMQFDDALKTMKQVSEVVEPGCVMALNIHLSTVTRWLRDVDPLNIYRYSNGLYKLLNFRGGSNRIRMTEYKTALESYGWKNVQVYPMQVLDLNYTEKVVPSLAKNYSQDVHEMRMMSAMICATR